MNGIETSKLLMTLLLGALFASPAFSGPSITFDFETATVGGVAPDYVGSANQRVSDYMTGVYGSAVTATGGAVWRNGDSGPDWSGKTSADKWLRTYGSASVTPGLFQISFDHVGVTNISGAFYVFDSQHFSVTAYDSTYGDRYNPNAAAWLGTYDYNLGVGEGSFSLTVAQPATLLVFSDTSWYDIAIDNLIVDPIPTPGAMLLGGIGVSLVGWLRRRRAV